MVRLGRAFLVAAVLLGVACGQQAQAQVQFIPPTVQLDLPTISFDSNINPVAGSYSEDALNIIRAHAVALQQVQAAILYLQDHRMDILEGKNSWYNETFGDFYDPNSPFAGQYNRIVKHQTGQIDRFGNPVTEDWFNTAHYDRVMFVYKQIQAALQSSISYAWGAQTGNAANNAIFQSYITGTGTIGDPLFGTPSIPDNVTPIPIDPQTGLPVVDPITGLTLVNPPLQGNPAINNTAVPLLLERGLREWGYSTSFTPAHLAQIATNPTSPLRWDADNAISTATAPLTPAQELAFFKDRLDAFAVAGSSTTGTNTTVYVGGAFLNESQRSNSSVTGEPNPFFHPTALNQYQMIISALAQSQGSLASVTTDPTTGTVTTNAPVSIEPGVADLFGQNSYFMQALDSGSYAKFLDVTKPVQDGGVGDGTLLPPPGKQGSRDATFFPLVPSS